MKKRIVSIVLTICMLTGLVTALPVTVSAENESSERTSELNDFMCQISEVDTSAVVIRTAEELAAITEGSYVLGNDIYLENYNDGIWEPIFPTGNIVLDGQGHKIYNLNVLTGDSSGLFGQSLDEIELKNLGIDYTIMETSVCGNYTGSLIGMAWGDVKIENCFTNIEIKANTSDSIAGGFVGELNDGNIEIKDSYNNGKIFSTYTTGGLIGSFTGKNISLSNCYNNGEIIVDNYSASTAHSAGIVGRINDANITITNCFNEGKVYALNGDCDLAGIVSWIKGSSALIEAVYNKGEICTNDAYSDAAGLFNIIDSWEEPIETINLKNCYNSGEITKSRQGSGLICEISGIYDLVIESCNNVGTVNSTEEYYSAGLIGSISRVENAIINNCYNAGSVDGNGLFEYIEVVNDAIIKNSYNCGNVTYDAFASIIDNVIIKECYNIGKILPSQSFISSANNSTIEKCFNSSAAGGFLGFSSNCIIDNCYNKGSIIQNDAAGGLVGSAHDTIIKNSYNLGNVNADDETYSNAVGGLIGYSSNVTLENCYNIGNVGATSKYSLQAGGLIGYVENGLVINNCHNEGIVIAKNAGGLIGLIYYWKTDKTRNISDSYNKGKITGKYRAGGIIGASGPNVYIDGCYNEGVVDASTDASFSYAGGLIGHSDKYSANLIITESYNLGMISSYSSEETSISGGLVGLLVEENELSNCYNTGSITSNDKAGGLVGEAVFAQIQSSFNKGTINGASYVGGIVGYGSTTLDNCRNISALIPNDTNCLAGGLIGYVDNTLTVNSKCSYIGAKNALGGKSDSAIIKGIENIVDSSNAEPQKEYKYDPEYKYDIVRYDDLFESYSWYQVTDKTDLSYLNHTESFSDCWEGKLVFVKYNDFFDDRLEYELLNVYPLKEYVGTVQTASENTLTLNSGITLDIGENLTYTDPSDELAFPDYKPEDYIGKFVCARTCNSEVVEISYIEAMDNYNYYLRGYDKDSNTISISNHYYTAETYYVSPAVLINFGSLEDALDSTIRYTYDRHKNIYSIQEVQKPQISYYETFKPSTWNEVESAANEFINAGEAYNNGIVQLMNKRETEEEKNKKERRKGAIKLMEKDNSSESKFLTFSAGMSDVYKIYAYEALYDALSKAHESSGVSLDDIKISGDIIKATTEIVKKITSALSNVAFTKSYDNYSITVNMNSFGGVNACFGQMTMRENGNTIDSNIVICSSTEDVEKAYAIYFSQLKELAKNSVDAACDAVLKEMTGKSIKGWGSWLLKITLKKYKPELLSKGAGDVYQAINTTFKTYKQIQDILKLKDKSEEKKIDKALSVYNSLLTEHYSDKSISDKMIDSLYKSLSDKFDAFIAHIHSYASNTEVEKTKKNGWWTSIKCPTNVYVYDRTGNLVGYIEGNYIDYNDEIVLEKSGDIKRVYLPDINDYEIKVVATDNGVLNYSVEQYVNNAPIGRINYYDIELYDGKEIIASSEANTIEDYKNIQLKSDNKSIVGEFISSTDKANINIWGMCEGNGNIIGLGSYAKGDGVVLNAVPDEGYAFDGWYVEGDLISTNTNYSFCATSALTITAKFYVEEIIPIVSYDEFDEKIIITSPKAFNEVSLFVAVYSEDRLLSVKTVAVNVEVGDNIFDSPITDYTNGDSIKIMAWDCLNNMKPLFDACVVNLD